MKVRDLQLQPVFAIGPDDSLADAADRMRFCEIGCLAVIENGEMAAVITERDLVDAEALMIALGVRHPSRDGGREARRDALGAGSARSRARDACGFSRVTRCTRERSRRRGFR